MTVNATLSIDLTTSWSPSTVEINEIERSGKIPVLNEQALLTDHSTNSFYIWGGYLSRDKSASTTTLWRFIANGAGGGDWSSESPSNPELFMRLQRSETSAYASSTDTGFMFGGRATDSDTQSTKVNIKGFATFNFLTTEWTDWNDDAPYSQDGSLWGGTATYVEQFGEAGIIVILGGKEMLHQPASGDVDFNTIHFYDIAAQKWHKQVTHEDSEAPPRRHHHCTVGAGDTSANGTYEM